MASDREKQRARSAQVGFLMRAYREAFSQPGKRRGLSQDELLERMAEVDASYGRRFSHATVTRWETGATRPNAERLRVFGKALDLSETEVEGLITLAGLPPPSESAGTQVSGAGRNGAVVEREDSSRDASVSPPILKCAKSPKWS